MFKKLLSFLGHKKKEEKNNGLEKTMPVQTLEKDVLVETKVKAEIEQKKDWPKIISENP